MLHELEHFTVPELMNLISESTRRLKEEIETDEMTDMLQVARTLNRDLTAAMIVVQRLAAEVVRRDPD